MNFSSIEIAGLAEYVHEEVRVHEQFMNTYEYKLYDYIENKIRLVEEKRLFATFKIFFS